MLIISRSLLGKRAGRLIIWLILSLAATNACTSSAQSQQLRIMNRGSEDIKGLSVLFPGATSDSEAIRIPFGDLPAGTTSAYQTVPSGVYRYAAYEYMLDGRPISQAVVDWMGEGPMKGQAFTYEIELDLQQPPGGQIQLVEVSVDKP